MLVRRLVATFSRGSPGRVRRRGGRCSSSACRARARRSSSRCSPAILASTAPASCAWCDNRSNRCPPRWAFPNCHAIASPTSTPRPRWARAATSGPPGEARRWPRRADRRQDARQLHVSGLFGGAVSPGRFHSLPPRSARRGRVVLDDRLPQYPLGQRPEHIASRFGQYRRLMDHWRAVLPVPILEVDYEETVDDLESVARRLVAACGLDWEPACLDFHRTHARSARPASRRCASLFTSDPSPAGRTTNRPWANYSRRCRPMNSQASTVWTLHLVNQR